MKSLRGNSNESEVASKFSDLINKRAVTDIGQGQIISVRDVGKPMTDEMLKKSSIPSSTMPKSEKSFALVYAKRDVAKGVKFTSKDIAVIELPVNRILQDALSKLEQAEGKATKFGVRKNQIITEHDLTL